MECRLPEGQSENARRRSDAIRAARVVCIAGVVYVHAWTGLDGHALELARGTPQEVLRWVLMEVFGRSAVPLLVPKCPPTLGDTAWTLWQCIS